LSTDLAPAPARNPRESGDPVPRDQIIQITRSWLGTPYHHQASAKGAGCDCLGLIRGVYTEVTGRVPATPMTYSRDWGNAQGKEAMLAAARDYLVPAAPGGCLGPGEVLIFRMRSGHIAKHAGIYLGNGRMVHAQEGAPVCEVSLGQWWRRRIVGVFSFPGVE